MIIVSVVIWWSASVLLRIVIARLMVGRLPIVVVRPWFGLPTFIIRGVPILIALQILIVVSVISTVVLFISFFIFPTVVVFLANTFILTMLLRVSISFVLVKPLVWLPTVALRFNSPNQCRGLIQEVILAFIDFVCPRVANGAMYLHIAIDYRMARVKADGSLDCLSELVLVISW